MTRKFVFAAAISVLAMAFTVSAQKAPADFSGKWNLDLAKSKLSDRDKTSIESQTYTVTQTATDIKIEPATKRAAPPAPPAGAPAGGGGGRGMGGGGDMAMTFTLGKETTVEQTRGQMTVPVTSGGKWDGSKLVLTSSSVFQGPNGEVKQSSKEIWELGADGKTLTVTRESTGMTGTTTTTKVFTKG